MKEKAFVLLLVLSMISMIPSEGIGMGTRIEISSVTIFPEDPDILDAMNVSIVLNEPPIGVELQTCIGEICNLPEAMTKADDDLSFYYLFPAGTLENDTYHFTFMVHHSGGTLYHDESVTVRAVPTSLVLVNLTPEGATPIVVFPGIPIEIKGTVLYDLGGPVPSAEVNITSDDPNVTTSGSTDQYGNFSLSVAFSDQGSFGMTLRVHDALWGLSTEDSWSVTVNEWPLPNIGLERTIEADPSGIVPGKTDRYYNGSLVELSYFYSNTGTGTAFNLTVSTRIENSTVSEDIHVGNLSGYVGIYEGKVVLPTDRSGEFTVFINATYDQEAPLDLMTMAPSIFYHYVVVDRPTWEDHIVLVEMFTQSTCVPCVSMEEAIESLHHGTDIAFEYVVYALDDPLSATYAEARGVSGTPHVFIDHDMYEIIGGGEVEDLISELVSKIENASRRNTPPIDIDFDPATGKVTALLSDIYTGEDIEAQLITRRIEPFSNLRNNQSIPMTNRFIEETNRTDLAVLSGGSVLEMNLTPLGTGMDYIFILQGSDGDVLQVGRTTFSEDPVLYLKRKTPVVRIVDEGESVFDLTIEAYPFEGKTVTGTFTLTPMNIPDGIEVSDQDGAVLSGDRTYTFLQDSELVLPVGRTKIWMDFPVTVRSLNSTERQTSFRIDLTAGGRELSNTIALIQTKETATEGPEIVDFELVGEGRSIFFEATVIGLPPGATVEGRVQPCTSAGQGGICGLPVWVTLSKVEGDTYRGPVVGLVLEDYDHLTYRVVVQLDDEEILTSEDREAEVSDLIDIEDGNGDGDGKQDLTVLIISVAVLLAIATVFVVVMVVLAKRNGRPDEEEVLGPDTEGSGPSSGEVPIQDNMVSESSVEARGGPSDEHTDKGGSPATENVTEHEPGEE